MLEDTQLFIDEAALKLEQAKEAVKNSNWPTLNILSVLN